MYAIAFQIFSDKEFNNCRESDKFRKARLSGKRVRNFGIVDDDDDIVIDWEDEEFVPEVIM